jgi:hypothetical protein
LCIKSNAHRIMIYWVTQSYETSPRYYDEAAHQPWTPVHDRMPMGRRR